MGQVVGGLRIGGCGHALPRPSPGTVAKLGDWASRAPAAHPDKPSLYPRSNRRRGRKFKVRSRTTRIPTPPSCRPRTLSPSGSRRPVPAQFPPRSPPADTPLPRTDLAQVAALTPSDFATPSSTSAPRRRHISPAVVVGPGLALMMSGRRFEVGVTHLDGLAPRRRSPSMPCPAPTSSVPGSPTPSRSACCRAHPPLVPA